MKLNIFAHMATQLTISTMESSYELEQIKGMHGLLMSTTKTKTVSALLTSNTFHSTKFVWTRVQWEVRSQVIKNWQS